MIILRKLTLQRGGKALLEEADLTIHGGQKIGVSGANGCGKSTLFAALRGEIDPDRGELEMPRLEIAHVAQETPALDRSAIDYVMDGDRELRGLEHELQAAEAAADGERLAHLHERIEAVDGYGARARAARLLYGLGFRPEQAERPLLEFSGGWRMRLNLAQALMCRSELLLLDEPTNHLDLEAVFWLEQWLKTYPGTLLVISHDRDFLDNTVTAIAHFAQRRLSLYTGNYADFERQRAAQFASQDAAFSKQQREVAHLHAFVERFRAKATKARQAQSRIKALQRMELITAAHVDSPFRFGFRSAPACPSPLLRLDAVSGGYGGHTVLQTVDLDLAPGARLALLGANGAGKSTLIKMLAGLLPIQGRRIEGKGLRIGYFAQHQLEQLRPEDSPLRHLQRIEPEAGEAELRDFLGGFGFRGDVALNPISGFSGGERSRLALALLVWQRPNLLLLDEPTNHLDLDMRHALSLALQEFEGAMVLVSHDRHLLRVCADGFLLLENGRLSPFDGDLEDYRRWRTQGSDGDSAADASGREGSPDQRKLRKRLEAEERGRLAALRRPIQAVVRQLEAEIAELSQEKARLDALLADPDTYGEDNKEALQQALLRQAEASERLHRAEEAWLARSEELEALSG